MKWPQAFALVGLAACVTALAIFESVELALLVVVVAFILGDW